MGHIERIDPPHPVDRNVERCADTVWVGGNKRIVTIEKHGQLPRIVVRGLGDDTVWECDVPELNNYAFFDLVVGRTRVPRANGPVMTITVLVQEVDAGRQEEYREIITDLVPDDRQW